MTSEIHENYCEQFLKPGETVLDIGSNKGHFICAMKKRGFDVYGIDVNPEYIRVAKENALNNNLDIPILEARGEALPFSDNKFQFVNCSEVTEHVEDPERLLTEIHRVLAPGGRCYVSFQSRYCLYDYHYGLYFIDWVPRSWTEPILKFLHKQKDDMAAGRQKLTTMHAYTYGRLIPWLEKIGFTAQDIRVEKIKRRYNRLSFAPLALYYLLRPFYFNTFHLLLTKPL